MLLSKSSVTPQAFSAIQKVDVDELSRLTEHKLRPLLPCLVRTSLIAAMDHSHSWTNKRKAILRILSGIELVNSIVVLLAIDFHALEVDVKKEQQLRQKIGGHLSDSLLIQSLPNGLGLEFERCDPARRLRLLFSELLAIMAQAREQQEFFMKSSEMFDNEVYLEEVSDVLCIAQSELPALLNPHDIAEALLHVKYGPWLICNLIANIPDCFREGLLSQVCSALVLNGEKQDEDTCGGQIRMQALRMLCQMNPDQALVVRAKCVEHCRMPALAVALTLDHCKLETANGDFMDTTKGDLVAFISGLLLGNDCNVRAWFAQYVRNAQKKKRDGGISTLNALREELLQRLQNIVLFSMDQHNLPNSKVVQASALLRLYCALKGIAGFKFQEDEINLLLQLLTSHPPPSPAGVRFVSLALCMLIACPSLIGTPDLEKKSIGWLKWLVKEEAYFERTSGVKASFGEVLLLIAIHFHSNQLNAISDLVCSILGMKVPIRPNNMARMKTIFTQEIFIEQVVTAHAIKVPVTPALSANITGFLPVHCIHQLLKSRAFTKHKVPIKDWIYKQVCATVTPLHPVLPPLIEAYVNSIIIPSTKGQQDATNEPIGEDEILSVFRRSVFMEDSEGPEAQERPSSSALKKSPSRKSTAAASGGSDSSERVYSMTAQLLLLYYLLLYEDVRLANMRAIVSASRKVKRYSQNFMASLPVKYLLQQAQKEQQHYAGLFSPLLRLLATHYPHLCLVEDWLYDDIQTIDRCVKLVGSSRAVYTRTSVREAFQNMKSCPAKVMLVLKHLLPLTARDVWPFADCIVSQFPLLLDDGVPLQVIELFKQAWFKLNTIFPGRLWVMTVNAVRPNSARRFKLELLTQDDLTIDPLYVLRCDERVFRCVPLLEINIRILRGFLAASRVHLSRHIQDNPILEKTGQISSDAEREELKSALILAQDSAAVQVLLEICLPTDKEKDDDSLLSSLREVQTLVCSHLHQIFIADPPLAKLILFQGYPAELMPVTVAGIPSMHICLDFIPELLSQPQLAKQIFAINLASHLCLQYALPKSFGIARLVINTMSTLLGVLPSDLRQSFFVPTLQALVRICQAFPPLSDDVIGFLLQLGRVCVSQASLNVNNPSPFSLSLDFSKSSKDAAKTLKEACRFPTEDPLARAVQDTLVSICDLAILRTAVY